VGIDLLIASIVCTAALTSTVIFLPAIVEISHPKDAGPRIIRGCEVTRVSGIVNLEKDGSIEHNLATRMWGLMDRLPNLELEAI
jgi:hypothetical protein